MSQESKRSLEVVFQGRRARVGWYPDTQDEALERAILQALELPRDASVRLRDTDGSVVALSASLPTGLSLQVELQPDAAPRLLPAVPGPRPYPIVGNIPHLGKPDEFYEVTEAMLREYGTFVQLKFPGVYFYLNSDPEVVRDLLARPEDFPKLVKGTRSPLSHLRDYAVGDGLFTADDTEESWHVAHRVLLPAMGAHALRQYFPKMLEVADDLLAHLEALGPDGAFLATDVMTRMTFETIAYAGFNTRFNCVDASALPTYVQAMVDVLLDAQAAPNQLLPPAFHPLASRRRDRATATLQDTVDRIVAERKGALERGEAVPNDMLQAMLGTRDKVTGKRLADENIRHQLNTLLIAGHETTSGLLSYALYHVTRNPDVEKRLLAEVDRVLGRDYRRRPTIQDIDRLEYTTRVLKETLRLNPTAPAFEKSSARDTVVAGRYPVPKGGRILTLLRPMQRDPRYWGEDAERFDPERFLPEAVASRHPNAYHPFGLGMRSCIGFQFALLEAKMMLARLYQRFLPKFADPGYKLAHVPTLTIKPAELHLKLERRPEDRSERPTELLPVHSERPSELRPTGHATALWVLYGSNMGASQELALDLGRQAEARGYGTAVAELDAFTAKLPRAGVVLVVCSTYNGLPPDDAARFCAWLASQEHAPDALKGLAFAVLGCGNTQWRGTYQKVPRFIHERLEALGAKALVEAGACDADGDFEAAAESWKAKLWPALEAHAGAQPTGTASGEPEDRLYTAEVMNYAGTLPDATQPSAWPLHEAALFGRVQRNDELQAPGSGRSTRHLEVALPRAATYTAGDHLGVFPENPPEAVLAAAQRCGLRPTDVVVLRERSGASAAETGRLPTGVPITVRDLLARFVDLLGPVTRRELRALARSTQCPPEKTALEALSTEEGFRSGVLSQRPTMLELLERYASVPLDLGLLVSLRPLLKPRYYSISSSPRGLAGACSITVGVHSFEAPSGRVHEGVGSHYLAELPVGSPVRALVKDTGSAFRLPEDPSRDVVLVGPGTGLAPFRGFLQERAAQRRAGARVGKTYLFYGCRGPSQDYLYRQELEAWAADGTLDGLFLAFSREPGTPKTYVQDRLREQGRMLWDVVQAGGSFFVCGDARRMAPAVAEAVEEVLATEGGLKPDEARARLEALKASGRYQQDVWAS
ncbi:MAG: cytochrome P450 [Deltaproteobacteria bacterium]|nr:cytochrome P450 [Deltaproteobacteria bacterium]